MTPLKTKNSLSFAFFLYRSAIVKILLQANAKGPRESIKELSLFELAKLISVYNYVSKVKILISSLVIGFSGSRSRSKGPNDSFIEDFLIVSTSLKI